MVVKVSHFQLHLDILDMHRQTDAARRGHSDLHHPIDMYIHIHLLQLLDVHCLVVVNGNNLLELLARVVLGLLRVDVVKLESRWRGVSDDISSREWIETYTLGLNDAVDENTSEASKDLLRLGVAVRLAVLRNVVLVGLGSLVKGMSGYNHGNRKLQRTS